LVITLTVVVYNVAINAFNPVVYNTGDDHFRQV
jgi:hypothetical protein